MKNRPTAFCSMFSIWWELIFFICVHIRDKCSPQDDIYVFPEKYSISISVEHTLQKTVCVHTECVLHRPACSPELSSVCRFSCLGVTNIIIWISHRQKQISVPEVYRKMFFDLLSKCCLTVINQNNCFNYVNNHDSLPFIHRCPVINQISPSLYSILGRCTNLCRMGFVIQNIKHRRNHLEPIRVNRFQSGSPSFNKDLKWPAFKILPLTARPYLECNQI